MSTIFLCPHKLPCQVSCFALVSSSQRFFPLFQWLNKNRRKQRAVNRLMWDLYRYTQEYIGVALMCGWQKSLNLKLTELCLMPTWKMWATTSIYWDILRNELTLLTKQQTSNGNDGSGNGIMVGEAHRITEPGKYLKHHWKSLLMCWSIHLVHFISELKIHHLYSLITTHDDFDSADPISIQDSCHLWTQLNGLAPHEFS